MELDAFEVIADRREEAGERGAGGEGVGGLRGLDAAFAHAIYDAVIRRWLTLEYLIGLYSRQPLPELEARLRAALLCGAAQILFLDRVPVHSAINHAVEWSKQVIRPGAGALVNAVLRRVAELALPDDPAQSDGGPPSARLRPLFTGSRDELPLGGASPGARVLAAPVLPEDELDRLAAQTSHPRTLLEHWALTRSFDEVRRLALHSLCDPPTILSTRHAANPGADFVPHHRSGFHVFSGGRAALRNLLDSRADLWVQDPASAAAIQSIADLRPACIIDLCAGQGTKTRQLAHVFPKSRVIATDIDRSRFERLSQLCRADWPDGRVSAVEFARIRDHDRQADLIVLDVPCSNTGVLPRRPEARYRFGPKTLESLAAAQRQIIADSIPLLKERPRGRILYSTCSLEPEENRAQAAWAARWHNLASSREELRQPQSLPGDAPAAYTDGSYSVLLG